MSTGRGFIHENKYIYIYILYRSTFVSDTFMLFTKRDAVQEYHPNIFCIDALRYGCRYTEFQHFQVLGWRNSLPLHTHPFPSYHCALTAEQWPVLSVAVIEKRDCSLLVARPSVSLSGLVSVAFVGGEGRGLWRARQPPTGSC